MRRCAAGFVKPIVAATAVGCRKPQPLAASPIQHQCRFNLQVGEMAYHMSGTTARRPRESKDGKNKSDENAHVYHVPSLTNRTAERSDDITRLWQTILKGHKCVALGGIDGVGKSTLAAEFCEAIKKTGRFTCIQWFNAKYHLQQQLTAFLDSMRGRKEKEVLIVFDDVQAMKDVYPLVVAAQRVATVLVTTTDVKNVATPLYLFPVGPLARSTCSKYGEMHNLGNARLEAIAAAVSGVPLLLQLASTAEQHSLLGEDPAKKIAELAPHVEGGMSVSKTAAALVRLLTEELLIKKFPNAAEQLALLSCFQLTDLNSGLLMGLSHEDTVELVQEAEELGLVSNRWDEDTFALHNTVAAVYREWKPNSHEAAADVLLKLWPRRWRNMNGVAARSLVWHTVALNATFQGANAEPTPSMLTSLERAATYLFHGEQKDLPMAAELWMRCYEVYSKQPVEDRPANFPDLCAELGKTLHVLRHPQAGEVLLKGLESIEISHGKQSSKYALCLSLAAPYTSEEKWIAPLDEAAAFLQNQIRGGGDDTLFEEEIVMMREAAFVLQMTRLALLRDYGYPIDEAHADEVKAEASKIKAAKSNLSTKKQ